MANLTDLTNQLRTLRKQIPFATAQAMTSVVRKIENAQKVAIQRHLDNPTPFTVSSVKSRGARKGDLKAKVFVMGIAASYLEPFEIGGVHKLNGSALLNPKAIKLNKYGNWPEAGADISDDERAGFMQKLGFIVGANKKGMPVWMSEPPPTHEQLVEMAEQKKQYLIAEVQTETQMLQTKLALGRIKEDEKALLNAWLDYLDELEAVDISTAPDITWPVTPGA